jgi:hypothetical protein
MGSQGSRGKLSDKGTAKQSTILRRLGVIGEHHNRHRLGRQGSKSTTDNQGTGGERGRNCGTTWEVAQRVRYRHYVIWGARSEREAAAREARQPRHSVRSPITNGYKVWSNQASTRGTV